VLSMVKRVSSSSRANEARSPVYTADMDGRLSS
jgi:hypothetical protein